MLAVEGGGRAGGRQATDGLEVDVAVGFPRSLTSPSSFPRLDALAWLS